MEELGRATLQIVHDLKNQLNGIKLYATFLRKRLEREERSPEEGETLGKLIAGLDRAARDLTGLVRYSQPLEVRPRQRTDLQKIIAGVITELTCGNSGDFLPCCDILSGPLYGDFDPAALAEALQAVTDEAINSVPARAVPEISLRVRREEPADSPRALIEWRGLNVSSRSHPFRSSESHGTVHTALAARIIEAHGGRFQCDAGAIRVWLPLSE